MIILASAISFAIGCALTAIIYHKITSHVAKDSGDDKTNYIYISGKITGNKFAQQMFFSASKAAQKRAPGCKAMNPMSLPKKYYRDMPEDSAWADYMIQDLPALFACGAIYMQSNWTRSKGAMVEHYLAVVLGLKIIYEDRTHEHTYDMPTLIYNANRLIMSSEMLSGFIHSASQSLSKKQYNSVNSSLDKAKTRVRILLDTVKPLK